MERAMGSEITVWWGPDDMVSALGFGTEEEHGRRTRHEKLAGVVARQYARMPDRPEAARGAGSGKAGAGGGTTGRKDRGGRSGASAGANGRGGRKSGGGRTNGGSGSRAGMGNDRVTGGVTGRGGTTPCRVYMYGTARPGDTGRGGLPARGSRPPTSGC